MIAGAFFGGRGWYKFSRNRLSPFGLFLVIGFILMVLRAPWIIPYPHHVESFIDFANANQPPSAKYIFGTDLIGRDVFSRALIGYRISLRLSVIVVAIAVPLGVIPGLVERERGGHHVAATFSLRKARV